MRAQLRAGEHQRVRHVVAVADIGDLQPGDASLHFQHRQVVGHRLAGMAVIGKAVDDRNARAPGHLDHDFVGEGANHDALHHALQVPGDVIHRLPLAEADLGGREIQRMTAKFLDADVERDARAQRRLLEDHGQRLALQRLWRMPWDWP